MVVPRNARCCTGGCRLDQLDCNIQRLYLHFVETHFSEIIKLNSGVTTCSTVLCMLYITCFVSTCVRPCLHACVHLCMHASVCVCICTCVCVCVCVYNYIPVNLQVFKSGRNYIVKNMDPLTMWMGSGYPKFATSQMILDFSVVLSMPLLDPKCDFHIGGSWGTVLPR